MSSNDRAERELADLEVLPEVQRGAEVGAIWIRLCGAVNRAEFDRAPCLVTSLALPSDNPPDGSLTSESMRHTLDACSWNSTRPRQRPIWPNTAWIFHGPTGFRRSQPYNHSKPKPQPGRAEVLCYRPRWTGDFNLEVYHSRRCSPRDRCWILEEAKERL